MLSFKYYLPTSNKFITLLLIYFSLQTKSKSSLYITKRWCGLSFVWSCFRFMNKRSHTQLFGTVSFSKIFVASNWKIHLKKFFRVAQEIFIPSNCFLCLTKCFSRSGFLSSFFLSFLYFWNAHNTDSKRKHTSACKEISLQDCSSSHRD